MKRRAFLKWLIVFLASSFGIVMFFKKIFLTSVLSAKPEETALEKGRKETSQIEPLLSFYLLSDLHVSADNGLPSKHLREALGDVQEFPIDLIGFTGDLTDIGRERDYKELYKILSEHKLPPIHANMGNHEYYDIWIDNRGSFNKDTVPNGKTDAESRSRFMEYLGYSKPYHDVWIKGYHFIFLSQECYIQERPDVGEGAWYSDEQMKWFEEMVKQHQDHKPFFVMIHQPLPPKGQDGRTHQLIRAKEFRRILEPFSNVFVFSGHQHRDFRFYPADHYVKETFHWFHNSSVGRVINYKERKDVPNSSQGLHVAVYNDHVVLKAREFTNRTWIPDCEWNVQLIG